MTMQPRIDPARLEGVEGMISPDMVGQPQPLVRAIPAGWPYPIEALGPLRAAVEAVQGNRNASKHGARSAKAMGAAALIRAMARLLDDEEAKGLP